MLRPWGRARRSRGFSRAPRRPFPQPVIERRATSGTPRSSSRFRWRAPIPTGFPTVSPRGPSPAPGWWCRCGDAAWWRSSRRWTCRLRRSRRGRSSTRRTGSRPSPPRCSSWGAGCRGTTARRSGSGKTLVYLEVLRSVVASGNGAILLVPEIALTPQTVARVRGVFGDQVAVLHSGLSDGERADAWRALRRGERRVAVGPRSAVFAPVQRLGAIVVDEEHESSYKQGTAPRYHARDVALERARLEGGGARVILGSATPSLETLHLAAVGKVVRFELPDRIGARPLPPVEVIDLRSAERVPDARGVPWTVALDEAVRGALGRGEQVILLLNRRGFATYLQCPACGDVRTCPRCAIALTVHQTPAALRCHYCGHEEPIPTVCRLCGKETQRMRGLGTQQLEHFVGLRFPEARIARMDLDTTSTKWAHHRVLERMAQGKIDILLGTQMIAKELAYPPQVGLVRFVASHEDAGRVQRTAERVAEWLVRANTERLSGALSVLGPAPCPIERLKGRWRWHVLVKAAEPRALGRVVRALGARARGAVIVDRDPVSLL